MGRGGFAYLAAGPGWIVPGMLKLLAGSFLAFLAVEHLVPLPKAAEPTQMYLVAFQYVLSSPQLALAFTGAFVIVSQLKINVTNAYAGSIAWSNFFSRLTHSHPGRVVWLVFNVTIALLLMELGIFKMLEHILGLYSIVAVAWVGALVADLVINKPLGFSPARSSSSARISTTSIRSASARCSRRLSPASRRFPAFWARRCKSLVGILALAVAFVMAPADRLGDARPFLCRARAMAELEWPGGHPLLDLRTSFREPEDMAIVRPIQERSARCAARSKRGAAILQAAGPNLEPAARLVWRALPGTGTR